MKAIRQVAKTHPEIEEEVKGSVASAKALLENAFCKLNLKNGFFQTVNSLADNDLLAFASVLKRIDKTFAPIVLLDTSKPVIIGEKLQYFIMTHCRERHYMFSVRKCGANDCVCGTGRTETDMLSNIHHLPDPNPMMFEADKFKHFDDCNGKKLWAGGR